MCDRHSGGVRYHPVMPRCRPILIAILFVALAGCRDGATGGVVALDGSAADPLAGTRGVVVLLFTRTDCPISNRYAPEVGRLADAFANRGVDIWLVYPDPRTTAEQITAHLGEYRSPCSALRDPRHALVARAGATVTPEAAVFNASREMVYCGRIDDRYVTFGQARPEPTRRDLENAIEAALSGAIVAEPGPVGRAWARRGRWTTAACSPPPSAVYGASSGTGR